MVGAVIVTFTVLVSSAKKIVDNLPENHHIKQKYLGYFYKTERSTDFDDVNLEQLSQKNS